MPTSNNENISDRRSPLAYRMAPMTLSDFVGQRHILSEGKLLSRMIQADRLSSIILFGPPGTGKTSIARVIANTTKAPFSQLNAVTSGVADIKRVIADTNNPLLTPGQRCVLFIDEIHRFNKAQQDALLPSVEDGSIILIGATTENPYFQVNKALISRSTVFQLYPLESEDVQLILERALADKERGLGHLHLDVKPEALEFFAKRAGGDARVALNGIELAALTTKPSAEGVIEIDLDAAMDSMQEKVALYDSTGEAHYDTVSAMIKSIRGSDPQAAIHYLARALRGGEDINFIGRRLAIAAAEEVGMANPQVLSIVVSAWQAAQMVGMPEAQIILSEAVICIATSPKSNASYLAIMQAMNDLKNKDVGEIPFYLRNAPAEGMKDLGYSLGYEYSHDWPQAVSSQEFLPENLRGVKYYEPSNRGHEQNVAKWMAEVKELRESARKRKDTKGAEANDS